jgi:pimeloyl-ACP methyl ester carboxylesterase
LIGMLAAQKAPASGFVSLEGASHPPDTVLRTQLAGKLPADLKEFNENALTALKNGKTVDEVPPTLAAYRPSVQPYLISWFRYDPAAEIRKLTMPILIIQGTSDVVQ